MLQRVDADIMFLDPNDVSSGSAALIEHGFDVEVLDDWIDDYGPAVWVRACITTDVTAGRLLDWVQNIVGPFNGDVSEVDLSPQAPASAWWHQGPDTLQ